jgi:hypothetical protein
MTQIAPPEDKKRTATVTVTFNGADRKITYNPAAPMQVLLNHAKQEFRVESNHLLSLFTESGVELRDDKTAAEAGIVPRALLILRQSTVRGGRG